MIQPTLLFSMFCGQMLILILDAENSIHFIVINQIIKYQYIIQYKTVDHHEVMQKWRLDECECNIR